MLKSIFTAICCAAYLSGWAQFTISGTVNDASGPLAGATVQSDHGNYFAISDGQGRFRMENVKAGEYVLLFRFLGFEEKQEQLTINESKTLTITLDEDTRLTDEVTVFATRAAEKSPTTFTNINKKELAKQNFGQDLPFVLNYTPSLVTTSDAGAGIGYTGLRIRGSDATRINVTINGIPYNDSESQGVFWVNIPDIATSTQSVQIQRGVGTSTNGPGAFGASINLQTNTKNEVPYVDVINSVGSFKTHRHTVGFGTGMINERFSFDARASFINSDGFIDRASSSLKSYYASGGYYGENTIIKAIAFGGHEVTYQSWYGVPESRLKNDVAAMISTAATEGWNTQQTENLLNSNSRTFNIYDYKNQVDNYTQDNFQLHFSHKASSSVTANMSFHYTPGKGYYEEFKYDQALEDYGLSNVVIGAETVADTDLIRRRWLDNDFYGITYSVNYDKDRYSSVLGGAWNRYDGDHFGEITWAGVALSAPKDFRYYDNKGEKKDFNIFWKSNYTITSKLVGYLDLQFRRVDYKSDGIDDDLTVFNVGQDYNFFNPKIGLTYQLRGGGQLYSSYAVGQREPVRSDFINAASGIDPKPEVLNNIEAGWRLQRSKYSFNLNYYLMSYKDQLVLTGELNDVGASIRTNVDESYRTGVELEGALRISPKVTFGANVTLSENKIKNFTEVIYDYGVAYDEYNEIQNQLKDVDISFSPSVIAGSTLSYNPFNNFEASLLSKYVGGQFLDNTSNQNRKIDAYFVNDLRLTYNPSVRGLKDFSLSLLASNIFDEAYESNGYTWGFVGGGETVRQNYFYPQAGRNYMAMLSLKF
ncbi:MAG: TonB-dependent receptor [Cyclobacteriaceae bacterium]